MTHGDLLTKREHSAEIDVRAARSDTRKRWRANRQTSVSFFPEVVVTEVEHHISYNEEEHHGTWYSKSELVELRRKNLPTIQLMRAGELQNDTDQHCSRGLEHRVYDRAMERKAIRLRARAAVFEEQDLQQWNEVQKPEEIALCYLEVSNSSAFQAHKNGLMDELQAFGPKLTHAKGLKRKRNPVIPGHWSSGKKGKTSSKNNFYLQFSMTIFARETAAKIILLSVLLCLFVA
eukprot:CAMPEP_0194209568 /NCGR_PEP_ID=MMETSP0156-20130528/7649_1 /TAXON_ID=33649 /ORGANISM="Thalassionema nitzschioides, Strain L26-B" /LENGTH=232 /DNA_ID=CAMNT_0038936763 /DNA_START=106 /DNA_END=802 /DNA_ORIENTATION=+